MKSAVVVGGSNGIGLAISTLLLERGVHVHVLDVVEPNIEHSNCTYHYCNLMDFQGDLFEQLSKNPENDMLIITAGLGRVAEFEKLDVTEIDKTMQINAVAAIKILRLFYHRIKNEADFYCAVMGSIAGLISSPMFSVYGASKAALCKFMESVNIELEAAGVNNRILNVSPGSIKGTKFNGGENDLSLIRALADNIIDKAVNRETLYIPDEEIYGDVLRRYKEDAHAFGLDSYEYKKQSGRVRESATVVGYLSGTFDLFHVGHLNLLKRAKAQCDYLIVGVHPSAAHKNKETYIPFEERKAVVGSVKYVDKVVESFPEDDAAWDAFHYNKLFVGSDYKGTERFNRYEEYFKEKNVEIVYFPYTTSTSSTMIRKNIASKDQGKKDNE